MFRTHLNLSQKLCLKCTENHRTEFKTRKKVNMGKNADHYTLIWFPYSSDGKMQEMQENWV